MAFLTPLSLSEVLTRDTLVFSPGEWPEAESRDAILSPVAAARKTPDAPIMNSLLSTILPFFKYIMFRMPFFDKIETGRAKERMR
jgi:hypothetical protein